MKTLLLLCTLLALASASAQVVPTTPTKFGKRSLGGGTDTNGATINVQPPKQETIVRTTTYLSLSQDRQWTSSEGKTLTGKVIAFEDITIETVKGQAPANTQQVPKLNGKPTVVKDGKVRLLVNQRPYELELEKFSQADRDFVETLKTAVANSK